MINKVNFEETLRYLGNKNIKMNSTMENLMAECEKEILSAIKPAFLYKEISLENSEFVLGNSIKKHLDKCTMGVIFCSTLGIATDNLIRRLQIENMAKAVIIDAMASVLIEEVCDNAEKEILSKYPNFYSTTRFSPGYGDYPIFLQKNFLSLLDAPKKIGLCTNDSYFLTPSKSVTAIIGLSKEYLNTSSKQCNNCNLYKNCKYRKEGTFCEF